MPTASLANLDRAIGGACEERLLNLFFVLYKNARIIDANNPTYTNQVTTFCEQLKSVSEDRDSVSIKVLSGRYFVNGLMTRYHGRSISGVPELMSDWERLGLAGVVFSSRIADEQVGRFFKFICEVRPDQEDVAELSKKLKHHGLPDILLLSIDEADEEADSTSKAVRMQFRAAARSTFFRAMSTVENMMLQVDEEVDIDVSDTKRVVQSLIDHITRDESSIIELTAIKNFDDYTYAHSTNVCVYALTLGLRLGLDRRALSALGFSALFHDIGKTRLSSDLVQKPGAFDENDWLQMQKHPVWGAQLILRNLSFDIHTARAARGAFEHHINQDWTGYPTFRERPQQMNLFSRIISIVDTFDALSSGRIYMRQKITPDEALRKMHFQMNTKFEPFLFKIFNSIVGIYPAGSLVLLSSEEIALVLTNNEDAPTRPYVKIVGNRRGLLTDAIWIDLSQESEDHRRILRIIDPEKYGMNVRDFVLTD